MEFPLFIPYTPFNSKVVNGSESMRMSPLKLRVLPQHANGWPPYSGIEMEHCNRLALMKTTMNSGYYISKVEQLREVIRRERRGKLIQVIYPNMIMRGTMSTIKQRRLLVAEI